jgi:ATP-dependent protease ClpP protease subunit
VAVKPNSDYRENPGRAIYVTGKIDQGLVDRLTPKINELRLSDGAPITAYIDSPGGFIQYAEFIRQLATAPDPNDRCCRLITVVTGTAASAAADFLALGDYSISYSHARIGYHGSRQSLGSVVTFESASTLASSLRQTNEFFAVRLARRAFRRFVLRLTQLKDEFEEFINLTKPTSGTRAIASLIEAVRRKLTRDNWRLVREALRRQRTIRDLTLSVGRHLDRFKDPSKLSPSKFESEILKAIINYKVKMHKNERWLLSGIGLKEVNEDFDLLHDFHYGSQRRDLDRLLHVYDTLFLGRAEKIEYDALVANDDEKLKWLEERSIPKLQPLWYFMVSLCRLLQSDDFDLDPKEAYWLGLVDEIPGSNLPNLRVMVENVARDGRKRPRLAGTG